MPGPARTPFGVLDAGSGKIACLIVEPSAPGLKLLGFGHQRSQGIKSGVVIDLEDAEASVRSAIAQAEKASGVRLEQIYLSVACGRLKSKTFSASASIGGPSVTRDDVTRIMTGARAYAERDGRMALHMNRVSVELDGAMSGLDPVGMAAASMRADIHAVTADSAPVRNLLLVLERCHLPAAGLYAAPLASALAATTEDDRQRGVTVIDIGAGTTKLASFESGQLTSIAVIPQGGSLLTSDIMQALHTPLNEAERIKLIYGNVISAQSDQHEVFSYPEQGPEGPVMQQATRAVLGDILRSRTAELLVTLMNRSDAGSRTNGAATSIVLTGGGAQLAGIAEFASRVLQCPVRTGLVPDFSGQTPLLASHGFTTVAGLAIAAGGAFRDHTAGAGDTRETSYVSRVGAWLKSGF